MRGPGAHETRSRDQEPAGRHSHIPWMLLTEHLPPVVRMRDVLDGVNVTKGIFRREVERTEIDCFVGGIIQAVKGDPREALLVHVLSFDIELNDSVGELGAGKPARRLVLTYPHLSLSTTTEFREAQSSTVSHMGWTTRLAQHTMIPPCVSLFTQLSVWCHRQLLASGFLEEQLN